MSDFFILHRKSTDPFISHQDMLVWSTCLRQIGFSRQEIDQTERGDEIYSGAEAMGFLLEVICGLHSPLIGETEVQGQFRQFLKNHQNHELYPGLFPAWQKVLTQSKSIRDRFLCKTGSKGYGSLIRQLIEAHLETMSVKVSILGAGHLVAEILPWLEESQERIVFSRSLEKAKESLQGFPNICLETLSTFGSRPCGTLVIAAPLSEAELDLFLERQTHQFGRVPLLLDLRGGDCHLNGEKFAEKFFDLKTCHQILQKQMEHRQFQKEKALGAIGFWKNQLECEIQIRPFGWEDLCG